MNRSNAKWRVAAVILLIGAVGCDVRVERSEASGSAATDGSTAATDGSAPEIPTRPVSGTVKGRQFTYEDASIEEGILKVRQGEDFFADLEVTVFLFLDDKAQVPEGRTWNIECEKTFQAGAPHIYVSWRQDGKSTPLQESAMCDYRLYLALGEETPEKTLPGRILLEAPKLETEVAGRFEAEIKGFRIVDGRVDLTQDDLDVAEHLAREWLAERHGAPVEIVDRALSWVHTEKPDGRAQAGYGVYWWHDAAGADTLIAKIQFVKRDGTWQVERELELWQVAKAHPVSPRDDLGGSLERRAAERFEQEHIAMNGRIPIFVTRTRTSHNPTVGMAEVRVRYELDPERARESAGLLGSEDEGSLARYLFRTDAGAPGYRQPDAWKLDRRLGPEETVDYTAGRVVKE